jgi:HEAT repeat protein
VRLAAVEALGSLGAARSALALLETVFADEPVLSELAAEAVRGLGPPALIFVEGAWPRWDPRQRRRALEVLGGPGGLAGVEIVGLLSARLDDADPLVALEAALQLARRGDDRARAVGLAFVGSADPAVARRARDVLDALERP